MYGRRTIIIITLSLFGMLRQSISMRNSAKACYLSGYMSTNSIISSNLGTFKTTLTTKNARRLSTIQLLDRGDKEDEASSSSTGRSVASSSSNSKIPMPLPFVVETDFTIAEHNDANTTTGNNSTAPSSSSLHPSFSVRNELKEFRQRMADEIGKMPYIVMKNAVINNIADSLPTTIGELSSIKGVGAATMSKYGDNILSIVRKCVTGQEGGDGFGEISPPAKRLADRDSSGDSSSDNQQAPVANSPSRTGRRASRIKTKSESSSLSDERKKDDAPATSKKASSSLSSLPSSSSSSLSQFDGFEFNARDLYIEYEDLTSEQRIVADKAMNTKNIFITGSAGTGKTFLSRYIIQELQRLHGVEAVAITAPTGVAAVNLGGQTIHSFAGIGLGAADKDKLVRKAISNKQSLERWRGIKVLVVDEISMVDDSLFELLNEIAQAARENYSPFGGIHLVLVGDFMQLPPVGLGISRKKFCFQSPLWESAGFSTNTLFLHSIERQNESEFISILNDVRLGKISQANLNRLNLCHVNSKARPSDGIIPTKLYCTNKDVDSENLKQLHELDSEMVTIEALDTWGGVKSTISTKSFMIENLNRVIPKQIELKVGAQVLLTRNRNNGDPGRRSLNDRSLVNGSRGVVVGFTHSELTDRDLLPIVRFDNGVETVIGRVEFTQNAPSGEQSTLRRTQVPLKLAWAITVHKSQGSTLSRAELMINNAFDYGQVYVALSRVRSLTGLWITHKLDAMAIKAHPSVIEYYREYSMSNEDK